MNLLKLSVLSLLGLVSSHARQQEFAIYYSDPSTEWEGLEQIKYVVLEPDHPNLSLPPSGKTTWIAYLSLGEIHSSRSYFPLVEKQNWVLPENPNWPGAHRIDPRSPEWKNLIIDSIIPKLKQAGWQGLFFDTVDNGPWLETTDSSKYAGSKKAMADLILAIRQAWPEGFLVMNNGFELLPEIGGSVDAVLLEGLNTRWDFQNKGYIRSNPSEKNMRIERMKLTLALFPQLQVWALDYSANHKDKLAMYARSEWKKMGWHGTLSDVGLKRWKCAP